MKKVLFVLFLLPALSWAQKGTSPEFNVQQADVEYKLRFLASDELKGRDTGTEENNIAASFIAAHLEAYGFQPAPGQDSYYQTINFRKIKAPNKGMLAIGSDTFEQGENLMFITGNVDKTSAEVVFAKHGWVDEESGRDDYEGLDVEGKIVIVLPGIEEGQSDQAAFQSAELKRGIAQEKGALALIELYRLQFPWQFFKRYFGGESLSMPGEGEGEEDPILYGWLQEGQSQTDLAKVREGESLQAEIMSAGYESRETPSHNVVGVLEGTDPELKDEYILLSAHFDHVGVQSRGPGQDSIFNGARDNGMGTVALLTAAEALSKERPKRSVIVLACTAEEKGLLGSRYYADNPLVPLEKTIFNLNTDGAGYNMTSAVSVIGWDRTGTNYAVEKSAEAFGFDIIKDPAPEQGLFDRSDNVAFAAKGIPALNFSPAFENFDAEIQKYYHQPTDEADAVDMQYLLKYSQAYAYIARLIANNGERPQWKEGDKYEEAGKKLYDK
jgi:hypothetical protein